MECRDLFRAIEHRILTGLMRLWIQQGRAIYEDAKGMMHPDVDVTLPDGDLIVTDLFDIACMTCDHCDEVCTSWGSRIDPPEYEDICHHPALPYAEAYEVLGTCRGEHWSNDPAIQEAYAQTAYLAAAEEARDCEQGGRLADLNDTYYSRYGDEWGADPAIVAQYREEEIAITKEYKFDPDTDGPFPGAHHRLEALRPAEQ